MGDDAELGNTMDGWPAAGPPSTFGGHFSDKSSLELDYGEILIMIIITIYIQTN